MKKIIFSILFVAGLMQLQSQTMYVVQKNGIQDSYMVNNIRKLTFSAGEVIVTKKNGISDNYFLIDMRYINFFNLVTESEIVTNDDLTLHLYPNPVDGILTIVFNKDIENNGIIEIISLDGRVVYTNRLDSDIDKYQIDTSRYPKGLYLLKVNSGLMIETFKFLKQ